MEPKFTPFACVQLINVQMTENTPQRCVRKDLVERTKPRKIYAAFSIFAQSTKGWRGKAKAGKDTDTSRTPDQHSRFPK